MVSSSVWLNWLAVGVLRFWFPNCSNYCWIRVFLLLFESLICVNLALKGTFDGIVLSLRSASFLTRDLFDDVYCRMVLPDRSSLASRFPLKTIDWHFFIVEAVDCAMFSLSLWISGDFLLCWMLLVPVLIAASNSKVVECLSTLLALIY